MVSTFVFFARNRMFNIHLPNAVPRIALQQATIESYDTLNFEDWPKSAC